MRNPVTAKAILIASVVAVSTALSAAVVAEVRTPAFSQDEASVKSRIENLKRLVGHSSGAKRIESSNSAPAKALHEQARSEVVAAEADFARGDMAAASGNLQRATQSMFKAIRVIGTGAEGEAKRQRDFDAKAKSVDVLLSAVERVAGEKGGKDAVLRKAKAIRKRAGSAQHLADIHKLSEARELLDAVYEDAKLELEQLREGETLVRSLNFASKEDEYRYELDRNDTHQMLLKVLLDEEKSNDATRRRVADFVSESQYLRARAEAQAKEGAYAKAVESLEEATKGLQRAIRSAGVYIPG